MTYTLYFLIILIGYINFNSILYYFIYLYDKYKKYQEYINSKKITIDYVDNLNIYYKSKLSIDQIKKLKQFKYVILNVNNKKFIIDDVETFDKDIEKLKNRTNVNNCIICSNVSITDPELKTVEYDLHEELSKFFVNDCIIDLENYKDLWISLLNKKNGTVYNKSCRLNWLIINSKLEKYKSEKITIKIINNLIYVSK